MADDFFGEKGGRTPRTGYTTGVAAALAAGAAVRMLQSGERPRTYSLATPAGPVIEAEILEGETGSGWASCGVVKVAGDDPDVTDGIGIHARVERTSAGGVEIEGGEGVGRVTRPGLDQPVGAAAINRVPRALIEREVRRAEPEGGFSVRLSIPGGEEIAARTFNPALGIVGGLSILGTSGLVEPMSLRALLVSLRLEMRMLRAEGWRSLAAVPGNQGREFFRGFSRGAGRPAVKYGNFPGEVLDAAGELGFGEVLLVGHAGKMIKLAGGIMDTHSRTADARLDLLALHAALAGGGALAGEVLGAATVEAGLDLLSRHHLLETAMASLLGRIDFHLRRRTGGALLAGAVLFSPGHGLLGATAGAEEILARWEGRND